MSTQRHSNRRDDVVDTLRSPSSGHAYDLGGQYPGRQPRMSQRFTPTEGGVKGLSRAATPMDQRALAS
eukprot:6189283-Pleurochrysis_carterae.AAC.2